MKKEVVILGGGFAGLAAGVELATRGHKVFLFEKRGVLGGRAYSFTDPSTGSVMDNGQHIFMGCYTATLRFLETIRRRDQVRFQRDLRVSFAAPGQGKVSLRTWPLSAPWNLAAGLAFFPGFSFVEKLRFLKVWSGLRRNGKNLDRKTVSEWLASLGQGERVRRRFWDLLAFAALNDHPDLCSAGSFEPVLREALFSTRKGSRIGFSRVGLTELYADPARELIEKLGGHVFLNTPATRLHFSETEFSEVELRDGRRISPDCLVLALPFTSLRSLLPERMIYQDPFFHPIHSLKSSPIVAINLWFDRDFVETDFVGFWETRVHWLFNKGRIFGRKDPYYSLVISGARDELKIPGPDLVQIALDELHRLFPKAASARLLHSHVQKEPEATLSPTVGTVRLSQKTPYPNLYLAGDWTDTGLPATIEGAVRSAYRVVEMIDLS